MASTQPDTTMTSPGLDEPKYGGYTRFELELEVDSFVPSSWRKINIIIQFVQSLSNPNYLSHLASQKILEDPAFIAYIEYLQYWKEPQYLRYLSYPGPTLKALELLRVERFRKEILSPEVVMALINQGLMATATAGAG